MVITERRVVGRLLAALTVAIMVSVWPTREGRAQTTNAANPIEGAWTLNRELSDSPQDGGASGGREGGGDHGGNRGGGGRRRGGGGGFGGGGFGGGGRGGGQGTPAGDPEETARRRNAMRDILNPPDRLTIVQTDSMVIITGPDGPTTRLTPDGKKIKDESTKIDRRTKWDGAKLVSDISGLPVGKVTETWSVDPEHRQLHISLKNDDDRRPLMVTRVYDADVR
jgi:hypothetical protein